MSHAPVNQGGSPYGPCFDGPEDWGAFQHRVNEELVPAKYLQGLSELQRTLLHTAQIFLYLSSMEELFYDCYLFQSLFCC